MNRLEGISTGRRWVLSLCASATVLSVPPALAGTVIDVKTVYFAGSQAGETATIFLDKNRVRFDAIEEGRPTTLIFRIEKSGEPLCWVIDKEKKTYVEFTRKSVEEIQTRAARAKGQFDEQMENAPPERREQIKKTMDANRQPAPGQTADARFNRVASGVKFNKWTCTQYEAYIRGEKQENLWAADETTLGLGPSDIEILREMGAFFSKFSTETNAFFQIGRRADEGGFDGFPVIVVEFKDGRRHEKSEVTAVRHEKLDSSVFELPKGARQQRIYKQP